MTYCYASSTVAFLFGHDLSDLTRRSHVAIFRGRRVLRCARVAVRVAVTKKAISPLID